MTDLDQDREFFHSMANNLTILRAKLLKLERAIKNDDKEDLIKQHELSMEVLDRLYDVLIDKKEKTRKKLNEGS